MKKFGLYSLFIVVLLTAAVLMTIIFIRHRKDQTTYLRTDPYAFAFQKDTALFLVIPDRQSWNEMKSGLLLSRIGNLPENLFPVISAIYDHPDATKFPSAKTLLGCYEKGEILWHPVRPGEKEEIEKRLGKLFPDYKPIEEKQGRFTLWHYPVKNRFFSCFYEDGIFCGTYNRRLLLESVACRTHGTGIASDSLFIRAVNRTGEFAQGHLFVRIAQGGVRDSLTGTANNLFWTGFDLNIFTDKLWLSGYLPVKINTAINSTAQQFDPYTFSSRILYGYCEPFRKNALPDVVDLSLDSLLKVTTVTGINTLILPTDTFPDRVIVQAIHLLSPAVFRQKISFLRNDSIVPDSIYRLRSSKLYLTLSGEYLYLSECTEAINRIVADLKTGNNLSQFIPASVLDQFGETAPIVIAGLLTGFPASVPGQIPTSLVPLFRNIWCIAELIPENETTVYCNICLFTPGCESPR